MRHTFNFSSRQRVFHGPSSKERQHELKVSPLLNRHRLYREQVPKVLEETCLPGQRTVQSGLNTDPRVTLAEQESEERQ